MACLLLFCTPKSKGHTLRRRRQIPHFDPILNASAYGPPPSLGSDNRERTLTPSALYLSWIPPRLAARQPKVKYPTTKDLPAWLDTTPISQSFLESGEELEPHTYRGVFTAPKDSASSGSVRPEDLCVNWLPPLHLKAGSAPQVAIDASTQVAAPVCAPAETVRVFDIKASKAKRECDLSLGGRASIPQGAENARCVAIDAPQNVATVVQSCTASIRLVDSCPSNAESKDAVDLEKPLPTIPSSPFLPELHRFSSFRPDSVLAAGQRAADEEVRTYSSHLDYSSRGSVMLMAMLASGEVARARRQSPEARDGAELLRTLESFDRFFEGGGEQQSRDAHGLLRVLERHDWIFGQ